MATKAKAAKKKPAIKKTVADLSESEVRTLLEDIVLSVREGKAIGSADDIYRNVEESLEKAGLDVSEKMPEGWEDD